MRVGAINNELMLMFPNTEFEFDDVSKYAVFEDTDGVVIYEIDDDMLWNYIRLTWSEYMRLHDYLTNDNVAWTNTIIYRKVDEAMRDRVNGDG